MTLRLFLIFSLASLATVCRGAPNTGELERVLVEAHQKGSFDGVALVAQRGRVLLEIPLGYADAQRGALGIRHRFNIGSIGKEFSAVAIMQLAERGKLTLDTPTARLVHGYPSWAESVTVRMLLDYTSGLPELRWREIHGDDDARADLRGLGNTSFTPGTQYAYTYNNVMLRQFIVEEQTGRKFSDVMRDILKRCGMSDSLVDPSADAPRVARSYSDDYKADPTDMPISGIVFVTARDLYAWSRCLNSGRAIHADSAYALGQSFNSENGGLGETRWNGRVLLGHAHNGESRNYEALLRYDARRDSTVVLLSNHKQQQVTLVAGSLEAFLD